MQEIAHRAATLLVLLTKYCSGD